MTCGIYEIKNKQDGRVYIGQSINIESRWKAHLNLNPINTCSNLEPTLLLANENPELVEFNIVKEIPEGYYDNNEIKFILSIFEKHELELRGGHKSDRVINVMPIGIPSVPPTILRKRMPSFVDNQDIIDALSKWSDDQRFERPIDYKSRYESCLNDVEVLENKVDELENKFSPKMRMSEQYEVYKLKQRIQELEDENEELEKRVTFWKGKCAYWREVNG